ncbi:hypothetical protein UCD39_12370 [Nitrospirillum sp. BR 11752]|uniref:hypothetical protein n=1 Tax=Nitrospirillum sp. BR 11752 TaxID=3104293 RepID=UPI002E9BE71E|nr:hypothetical protein [Nitrospirillum sp. BR 11752]
MSYTLTIIYDDRQAPPAEIEGIIGAVRYSDILRRRTTLGQEVLKIAEKGGAFDFFHLVDDRDAIFLSELVEASPYERLFLRLPSCLMPIRQAVLSDFIAQAEFAPGTIFLAPLMEGEAASLLTAKDLMPVLRQHGPTTVRDYLLGLSRSAVVMDNPFGFVDLRQAGDFLSFMSGATETRAFNSNYIERRSLRKSSTDRHKMAAEYGFFHVVPEALKPFLLATYDFKDDGERASYAMERLAIPDAALQLIHHAFDQSSFATLLERFIDFIDARPRRDAGVDAVRANARDAILGKMNRRLKDFLALSEGRRLNEILLACGPCGGLEEMAVRAGALIEKAIARDTSAGLVIGHGDACFSNILFDRRTGLMRLIDPRGARTLDEGWMHPAYDLAKFSHSILGGYDFVNNDLFDCQLGAGLGLGLALKDGGPPPDLQEQFTRMLDERALAGGVDRSIVRSYELSLFMSMLPLHVDHPRKLAGFALIAASLICDLEREK